MYKNKIGAVHIIKVVKKNKKRVCSMGDKQDCSWAGLEIKNKKYFAK